MTRYTTMGAWVVLACAAIAAADDKPKTAPATTKADATFLNVKDLKWMAAPPDLPKGAQITVLYGDPTKPGTFTMRLKAPDGYKIPPHWHTQDEHLTIVAGTLVLYMGDAMKSEAHALDPGGYHYLPGGMHHSAETRGETVVQINGHGPFDIHYINPADNPNPQTAKR